MYEDIRQGLKKTKEGIKTLRPFQRAAMLGVVLPTGGNLDKFLPSFMFIAAVSILDEALERYIGPNHQANAKNLDALGKRIQYLGKMGKLKDERRLLQIKNDRNKFAHEMDQYATWDDLTTLLADIDEQLKYLGIL